MATAARRVSRKSGARAHGVEGDEYIHDKRAQGEDMYISEGREDRTDKSREDHTKERRRDDGYIHDEREDCEDAYISDGREDCRDAHHEHGDRGHGGARRRRLGRDDGGGGREVHGGARGATAKLTSERRTPRSMPKSTRFWQSSWRRRTRSSRSWRPLRGCRLRLPDGSARDVIRCLRLLGAR